MLSIFAKILLVSTSLSPVLLVMAVNQAERCAPLDILGLVAGPSNFPIGSVLDAVEEDGKSTTTI